MAGFSFRNKTRRSTTQKELRVELLRLLFGMASWTPPWRGILGWQHCLSAGLRVPWGPLGQLRKVSLERKACRSLLGLLLHNGYILSNNLLKICNFSSLFMLICVFVIFLTSGNVKKNAETKTQVEHPKKSNDQYHFN